MFEGDGNLHFVFKGVRHTAKVYLDGQKIVDHYNAFTPFEATGRGVYKGIHKLAVQLDNSFNEESALYVPNNYFTYGGINRLLIVEKLNFWDHINITFRCFFMLHNIVIFI